MFDVRYLFDRRLSLIDGQNRKAVSIEHNARSAIMQ
jgi:hypothetical protein